MYGNDLFSCSSEFYTALYDLNTEIDTVANLQIIINRVKKKSRETKIMMPSLLMRLDQGNIEEKVLQLNSGIKKLCEENLIDYIYNKNIDNSCLGKGKLHRIKRGKLTLQKHLFLILMV